MGNSGWNRPSAAPKTAPKKTPGLKHGILAGLLIVALGGLCLWMFSGGDAAPKAKPAKDRGRIKAVTPAKAPKAEAKPAAPKKIDHPKTVQEAIANIGEMPKPMINKRELTPEEWYKVTNRVFSSGTEQIMSWIFTRELGDMPVPIPHISEDEKKDIVAILFSKNPVKESDSERTALSKDAVAAAKKAMIDYLKEGGDPDEFLQYYGEQLKTAFDYRMQIHHQVNEIIDEGELELARDFVGKANELLEEKGIKPWRVSDFSDLEALENGKKENQQ